MPRAAIRPKATAKHAPTTRAFLFSDLRGYTSFVEGHGDAAAAKLLREYRTLVRKEVAREHGAEVKTEGDSFYVVFESAVSALDCAVGILRRAEAHNAKGLPLSLRVAIGLHAGDTVKYDKQFVGSAVNIAARLVAKAGEGELLVSDTLRGLVRTGRAYPMTDRGQLKLKGVSERVRGWLVDWREAQAPAPKAPELVLAPTIATRVAAPTGQMLCPTVVGRDAEAKQVAERLDRALTGDGSTIVLGGDAGVGKSALVRRAQDLAAERGFRLLTGLTLESSSGLPYAPFVSAVRSGFRGLEHERLGRVLAQVAPALAQLFPELGRQATRPEPPSGLERHRLSVAFQQLFHAFVREAPVLLVLEDLHWADEASLELLGQLARELRDARVLVLATYRSDELHRRHPFLRALANLQRERLVTTISLRRLSREEVGELIRLTFRREEPVSDEFRDAIYARTEGNPFFTEELLKALVDSGELFFDATLGRWTRGTKTVDELKIPDSIVDAVRGRLERLSPDAQTTLATAAVIGQRFSFELLRAVRGAPVGEIETHLREFIEQQLVAEHSGGEDAYAFRHALSREVVYDDLLVSERKRLHAAVADGLAAVAGVEPSLLAHHLVAAGESKRAVPQLLEAAARALRADAPREAVAHYERAIEIGVADGQRPAVLEELARAYLRFDIVRAAKVAEEAVSRYRELGDRHGQSRALRLASRAWYLQGDGAKTTALAREAIDVLDGLEESVELGQAIAGLAGWKMTDGSYEEAHELADRAITIGERFKDWWTVSNALITKGSASRGDDLDGSIALTLRGRDMAIAHDLPETAIRAYNNATLGMMQQQRPPEERIAFIDEGIGYAKQHGLELLLYLPQFRAQLDFGSGEWDAALLAMQRYRERTPGQEDSGQGWVVATMQAREGPRPALPLALQQAERGLRRQEGQSFVPAVLGAAAACVLASEPAAARSWTAKLRDRLDSDPAASVHMGNGPSMGWLITVALMLDEREWLDRAGESLVRRHDPIAEFPRALLRGARALFDRDSGSCARALDSVYEKQSRLGFATGAANMTIFLAVEARRRGLELGPEWDPLLARARAFAERAKATWWLLELDRLRT